MSGPKSLELAAGTVDARRRWLPRLAFESFAVAVAWIAMDAFLHLRLRPVDLAVTIGIFLCCLVAGRLGTQRRADLRWFWVWVESALPALFLPALNLLVRYPLSLAVITCSIWVVFGLRYLCSLWRFPDEVNPWAESGRRIALICAALWVTAPLFTDRILGGVDARWYAFMLADFLEQFRAGVFPVLVGQTEYAYNGAVHPLRSAPIYMWIAGVWDLLTLRGLSFVALQHLSAITAGLAACIGFYVALLRVAPARRWAATLSATIYIAAPGVLAPLYCADMYMTFMTLAALPWVATGNIRTVATDGDEGWKTLSAGLVLTWMCHPPSGMFATLVSAFVQVLAWSVSERPVAIVLGLAARGAVWFVGLGAYYFASMSELPKRDGPSLGRDLLVIGSLSVIWFAAVRASRSGAKVWWLIACGLVPVLWWLQRPWALWAAIFCCCCFAMRLWQGRQRAASPDAVPVGYYLAGAALALIIANVVASALALPQNQAALAGLQAYSAAWYKALMPLSPSATLLHDFQPGYAVVLLLGCALLVGWREKLAGGLLAAGALVLLMLLFRVPGVSDFLIRYVPPAIAGIGNIPLPHRLLPVATACAVVAGFVSISGLVSRARVWSFAALVLVAGWSLFQSAQFVQRGFKVTSTRAQTARALLSENVILERFAYDLLPIPKYFSNGKSYSQLETRILEADGRVRFGPDQIAGLMEGQGVQQVTLTAHPEPTSTDWLKLEGKFTIPAGDLILARFQFDPRFDYSGYLIGRTPFGDYREYGLPESGMSAAFGSTPNTSKVMAINNSLHRTVEYTWDHALRAGHTLAGDGRLYAAVTLSKYDARFSPVQVESLLPFRARINLAVEGVLETPRVFLPGYSAKLDGNPAKIVATPERLVGVGVPAGLHTVEVRYVGTVRVWLAAFVSGAFWVLLVRSAWRSRESSALVRQSAFS